MQKFINLFKTLSGLNKNEDYIWLVQNFWSADEKVGYVLGKLDYIM